MKIRDMQILLASFAILSSAALAQAMIPRVSMARTMDSFDLERVIPRAFGEWKPVPDVGIVEPPGSDTLSREIYSQEIGRGYTDRDGHVVMLLIAYGVSQSDRLQLHRPEICYAAQGFRVSRLKGTTLSYSGDAPPIRLAQLVAQREARLEPVSYWMRIGNDVATGVVERQFLKVTYGLHGLIPDGVLVRVSTTGVTEEAAYEIEAKFIQDLLFAIDTATRQFLVGDAAKALSWRS
jgi:EpsI family protein